MKSSEECLSVDPKETKISIVHPWHAILNEDLPGCQPALFKSKILERHVVVHPYACMQDKMLIRDLMRTTAIEPKHRIL